MMFFLFVFSPPNKYTLKFHAKETMCMNYLILFSGENKKTYFKVSSAEMF